MNTNINNNINKMEYQNVNQNINIDNSNQIKNNQYEEKLKNKIRMFFIILIFIGILISIGAIYLLIDNNNKYKTYIAIPADLIDYDKINKNGLTYYKGNYKYIIDKNEYFYTPDNLSSKIPDKIIQIKYNSSNPNDLYNENLSKIFFIILFSGLGLSFISLIIAVALSSNKLKEIAIVQVIEQINCVGGRRVYLSNINIRQDDKDAQNLKYYVYFTDDINKFAIGNKLSFNIYKYGEAFTTEKYKNITARAIYNFKNDDFTLLN